jgi:hypothetical protein
MIYLNYLWEKERKNKVTEGKAKASFGAISKAFSAPKGSIQVIL